MAHVSADGPPVVILHGDADERAPIRQDPVMQKAPAAAGRPHGVAVGAAGKIAGGRA